MDSKSTRPVITIQLTDRDKAIEKLSLWLLILLWIGTLTVFFILPDQIPVHFNLKNVPDRYGSKGNIVFLPFIATILFYLMGFINKYPQSFNYLKPVTPKNAESMYRAATGFLRSLRLFIIFGFIVETTEWTLEVIYPTFHESILSILMQWSFVVLILGYVLATMVRMLKKT